ncbi:MAG TPA: hypothetical protein DHV28_06400 [Ignavibacteriales bacterium]|nr:hypothetical protein [Ignavibacteriales bacterium]
MNTRSRIMLLLTFCFFGTQGLLLSQSIQSELKSLTDGADVILTGKVINQTSSWNADRSRIYTEVTLRADEYLKGDYSENTLSVKTLGGEVGDVGELYSHMPKFTNDEEVLLFVKKDNKDLSYRVLNGEEGKLTLYEDKATGEKVTSFNKKISTLKKEIKSYVELR